MIGSAGPVGVLRAGERAALEAVARIGERALVGASARPSPCMPTPRRAAFIIVNMAFMPLFSSPTSQPVAPSKFMTQVAEALMPILCSIGAAADAVALADAAVGLRAGTSAR